MNEQTNKALIAEKQKRLQQRNWALAGALVLFVVLVFVISLVKMGGA
ncbi:hypothetical protein [Dongia mobilis]|jgi:hypothetical protein